MTFLHPWALWIGVAAVGLPLLIHLLTKPRPVRLPLSTLRFVREAIRQRRARHRLRDAVILALRALAALLVAWAIARPLLGPQPLVSDRQTGDALRVVILDVSQSMAAAEHGIEAIERARTVAAGHLRYRPGLAANLIVAGAMPRAAFEQVSTNFDALRDELARCQVLPQRVDVPRAIGLAARMLAPASDQDTRRRELVVVSDFQRANWGIADFAVLPEGTQIQLESVAPAEPPENLAIESAGCQVHSAQGRSARLAVEVGNLSFTPRKVTVEVTLGEATYRLTGTCAPGRSTTLTEEIELRQVGWQSGEARLVGVDDALSADNARPLVVRVKPSPLYALLTRQPASQRPSSSHYLECALAPERQAGQEAGKKEKDPAERRVATVLRVDPSAASLAALASADVIVLDHPGKLSDDAIKLLAGLMRRGRPILYVAGELVDAVNLKRLADSAGGGLQMPVEFTPPPEGRPRRDLVLAAVRAEAPPFEVFGDGLDALKGRLRFAGGLSSRRLAGALDEELLASYGDGTACLVLSASDAGTLAVLNADLAASSLPKSPAFVPLVGELVERMMARDRARPMAYCGEPLVANLPTDAGAAAGLRIASPQAAGEGAGGLGELVDEGVGVVWRWPNPTPPGVYRVQRANHTVFALAVETPPEESRLEYLSPEVLQKRLAAGHNVYYHNASVATEPRDDVWTWLLAACVVCLLGELTALLTFRT
jgi:hypothetical protein